jgi:hypothetical protein
MTASSPHVSLLAPVPNVPAEVATVTIAVAAKPAGLLRVLTIFSTENLLFVL